MPKPLWMLTATLMLASCGGTPAGKDGNTAAPEATPATATSFNAEDACALLPKEKVAEVTGLKVDSATLSRVIPATADTAGFSSCSYGFAGGGSLDFFARKSPVADNTPEAIQRTKQGMIDNLGAKPVDVPGLGAAAFSVEQMHQLHVFIGGDRYIYFVSAAPPAGKPIGEIELALARAVIG
jgi:hypothetical protein